MTTEALARLETLYSILAHTLKLDDRVDWETLKERTPFAGDHRFPESEPQRKTTPEPRYQEPNTGLWDVIFGRKGRKLAEAKERYESDLKQWQREESCNAAVFSEQMSEWKARKEAFEAEYAARKRSEEHTSELQSLMRISYAV